MTICFVLKGYPRLSETFIAQEVQALERRGVAIRIASLRHPTDRNVHPVHRDIAAEVTYLPEYLHQEPARIVSAWSRIRRLPGYRRARDTFLGDLRRDATRNRIRRFGQACVLADELPADTTRLHAHFLHTPASVARYAALMRALPWSCSAHAKDIWTTPQWEIAEKLRSLDWLVTCTAYGAKYLQSLAPKPDTVSLLYHGLDFDRFPPPTANRSREPGEPLRILSVGRAVAKKGYDDLLDALARISDTPDWHFYHVGGGPLLNALRARAQRLGIADRIEWRGPQPQQAVLAALREADIFALASKTADDGDRDGLPNVLMEAQSQALPVVATTTAGIPELVLDEQTGLLAPPGNPQALADALARLVGDANLRRKLGDAGYCRVRAAFSMKTGIDLLAARFGQANRSAAA